jgi:hypothetical protein
VGLQKKIVMAWHRRRRRRRRRKVCCHVYTPQKDGNYEFTTWPWDNIRFNGPVTGRYEVHESNDFVCLEANGDRPLGDTAEARITLPEIGDNPHLFGQVHSPIRGQVLVSANGSAPINIDPHHYMRKNCYSTGWSSFRTAIPSRLLRVGDNVIRWTVGPPDACNQGEEWNGFSVKDLEIQFDVDGIARGELHLNKTPSLSRYRVRTLRGLTLSEGNHRIRVRSINGRYRFDRFKLVNGG